MFERLENRHAAGHQRAQRAGRAGQDVLFDQRPEDRHLEHEHVPADAAGLELANQLDEQQQHHGDAGNQVPVVDRQVRNRDQHERHRRQLGVEILEDLFERGHDLDHDERQDAHGHRDDDDRVDHRALDLAFERLGPLLELGQALQNDFQRTARLAGLDHVDVQAVEGLGALAMASERVDPPSISSQTSIRLFLSGPAWHCASRIRRLRKIGKPASCRIESWRVKVVSTLLLTPPMANARLRPPLALSAAAFLRLS